MCRIWHTECIRTKPRIYRKCELGNTKKSENHRENNILKYLIIYHKYIKKTSQEFFFVWINIFNIFGYTEEKSYTKSWIYFYLRSDPNADPDFFSLRLSIYKSIYLLKHLRKINAGDTTSGQIDLDRISSYKMFRVIRVQKPTVIYIMQNAMVRGGGWSAGEKNRS